MPSIILYWLMAYIILEEVDMFMDEIYYFARAHSASGPVNKLRNNIRDITKIYLVQGSDQQIHYFFKQLKKEIEDRKDIGKQEWIVHAEYPTFFEGVIFREKSLAIIHTRAVEQIDRNWKTIYLSNRKSTHQYDLSFVYKCLHDALSIHLQLEKIYVQHMDFDKANGIIQQLIDLLNDKVQEKMIKGHMKRRFFGSFTLDGPFNVVEELIRPIKHVYHIKGKEGTGKSYLLNRLIEFCQKNEIGCEIYHCSFDPSSVDMVILRDYNLCFFDSTAPHAFTPDVKNDKVIDMYAGTIDRSVETTFAKEIALLKGAYQLKIKEANIYLKQLKNDAGNEYIPKKKREYIQKTVEKIALNIK